MFKYLLAACLCLGAAVVVPASFVQSASAEGEDWDDFYLGEDEDYDVYGFFENDDDANRCGGYLRRHKKTPDGGSMYAGWAIVSIYTINCETGKVIFMVQK